MIKYDESSIEAILPVNLKNEPEIRAISYAIQQQISRLAKRMRLARVYVDIDSIKDEALDLLALELRTQYYSDNLDIEIKRSLIRNTLLWYQHAGTSAAVEELVTSVFGDGEVTEWFDYGGKPYYFKIRTEAILQKDMISFVFEMIRKVKNARSHLEAIEIKRNTAQECFIGCVGNLISYPAAIMDGYQTERKTIHNIHTGIGIMARVHPMPVTDGYDVQRKVTQIVHFGSANGSYIKSTIKEESNHATTI